MNSNQLRLLRALDEAGAEGAIPTGLWVSPLLNALRRQGFVEDGPVVTMVTRMALQPRPSVRISAEGRAFLADHGSAQEVRS